MHDEEPQGADRDALLSPEQMRAFEAHGHLRLEHAFSPDIALQLQERMWAELSEDFGIGRDDPGTWCQPRRTLRGAKWDPLQRAIATKPLVGAIDALLGRGRWHLPSNWGVVLVTFPDAQGEWTLPSSGCPYDFVLHQNVTSMTGLLVFTFFSEVGPHGGGTLIVEGSHRLLRRFSEELSPREQRGDHREIRRRFL